MKEEIKNMIEHLQTLRGECIEVRGRWNGDESGSLENQANLYEDIEERLIQAQGILTGAFVVLAKNE